ncbi:MAG: hypothetical protein PHO15_03655 [Eubacteriales bacterium]|nr:hypothetical protein [Eubacteriales bacterium]
MKKVFCDICGEKVESQLKQKTLVEIEQLLEISGAEDICDDCLNALECKNISQVVLNLLKSLSPNIPREAQS